ncbi:MAG: hypothetical protein HQL67_10350 [Magnetococcales bacterium]|nr:hypothetical protein [Magnetococcales bacterium]
MGSKSPPDLESISKRISQLSFGKSFDSESLAHDLSLAETYLEHYPATSHSIMGMIATFQGNEEKMRYHFEAIRTINGASFPVRINFIMALQGIGCFSESVIEAREANQIYKKNPPILAETVFACIQAGRFHEATQWMDDYDRLTGCHDTLPGAHKTRRCALFLRERQISDRDLESIQLQAASLLREERVMGAALRYQIREDESDRWLSFRYQLSLPEEKVVALEWELGKRLAESRLSEQIFRHFSIGFLTASE